MKVPQSGLSDGRCNVTNLGCFLWEVLLGKLLVIQKGRGNGRGLEGWGDRGEGEMNCFN